MGRALAAACVAAGFLMPPAVWMITALFSEPMWLALALPWLVWATGKERRAHHACADTGGNAGARTRLRAGDSTAVESSEHRAALGRSCHGPMATLGRSPRG